MVVPRSRVDVVIEEALRHAAPAYAARSIRVEQHLASTIGLATHEPVMESSLAAIFSGLPAHLAPGSRLRVWTFDRAGGDIELVWEADELEELDDPEARHGDLFSLALEGLERLCRARHGRVDVEAAATVAGATRRRSFLIPPLRRTRDWEPLADRRAHRP